jgi:FixJ family two-component response regulator
METSEYLPMFLESIKAGARDFVVKPFQARVCEALG